MGVVLGEFFRARFARVLTTFVLAGVLVAAPALAAHADVDPNDRGSVASGYTDVYAKAVAVPMGWTGSASSCTAGSVSAEATQATLDAINYVRALGALDPVTFNATYSAKAQEAALVYEANRSLSHEIPSDWKCRTTAAVQAGKNSNIALGAGGARAIGLYMRDSGDGNVAAGHRRWIMNPSALTFGTGSTASANALWVFGATSSSQADPAWVSWPTAGYFPSQLEPAGRWSLTSGGADFSDAKVSVKTASGTAVKVTKTYTPVVGYADPTLVWEMGTIARVTGTAATTYRVTVSGIKRAGSSNVTKSYDIHLIDATAAVQQFTSVGDAQVSGFTRVGQKLAAVAPQTAPESTSASYAWKRNGRAISGATKSTYTLTTADLKATMSVVVSSRRADYESATSVATAEAPVSAAVYPAVTTVPTVSGTRRVGETLSVAGGEWSVENPVLTYAWYRNGKLISGKTASSYTLTSADRTRKITAKVRVSAPGYSAKTFSVRGGGLVYAGVLTALAANDITGSVTAGGVVTVTRGEWVAAPTSYSLRWYVNGKKLSVKSSFRIPASASGKALVVYVTAKRAGYTSLTQRVAVVIP